MEDILNLLSKDARHTAEDIAKATGKTVAAVKKAIKKFEQDGTILQYKTVINSNHLSRSKQHVRALIEVGVSPQKRSGFDHVAERIYKFPEVVSCYLLSGSYDLQLVVEGDSIHTVADFVASKLSPLESVRSTTTHFLLKTYKEDGKVFAEAKNSRRLNISY